MIRACHILLLLIACAVESACGDSDPLLMIHTAQFGKEPFKWVWAVPQSRLAAVAQFDPVAAELPISPHQAIAAASEFIRTQYPASTQLTLSMGMLLARGIEKNPVAEQLWMYEISFTPDPLPEPYQDDLLRVMVLMDGKVVVPSKQPSQ
jgi:hypothetical protein